MTAPDVEGWDSLNHVTLVVTLEEQFDVKFTTREVMGWQNVGQMLDCRARGDGEQEARRVLRPDRRNGDLERTPSW